MPTISSPQNGGSAIISYQLEYDDASGATIWTVISGYPTNSLLQQGTVSSSITIGATYKFRYRAKNLFGWGPYSDTLDLYAASVPTTIATATTVNQDTSVLISWSLPTYNGGLPILAYRIYIEKQTTGTYAESASCNGADPTIRANRYCLVPMSALVSGSFNLPLGRTVKVTVES